MMFEDEVWSTSSGICLRAMCQGISAKAVASPMSGSERRFWLRVVIAARVAMRLNGARVNTLATSPHSLPGLLFRPPLLHSPHQLLQTEHFNYLYIQHRSNTALSPQTLSPNRPKGRPLVPDLPDNRLRLRYPKEHHRAWRLRLALREVCCSAQILNEHVLMHCSTGLRKHSIALRPIDNHPDSTCTIERQFNPQKC